MAAGNRHLGYKEALNAVERTSPGHQARLLLRVPRSGPPSCSRPARRRARARPTSAAARAAARRAPARCAPSAGWSSGRPAPSRSALRPRRRPLMGQPFEPGRPGAAGRRQAAPLPGHPGRGRRVPHPRRVRAARRAHRAARTASVVTSTRNARYTAFRPTLVGLRAEDATRRAGHLPKDLGPLLLLADVFPGARVFESGVGSGALSMTLLRAGAEVAGYELREDFADAGPAATSSRFLGDEALDALQGRGARLLRGHRRAATSTGSCSTCPSPGRWCRTPRRRCAPAASSSPTPRASCRSSQLRAGARRQRVPACAETLEVLHRTWHVEGASVRPDHRMVAHTGFLTHARLLQA